MKDWKEEVTLLFLDEISAMSECKNSISFLQDVGDLVQKAIDYF